MLGIITLTLNLKQKDYLTSTNGSGLLSPIGTEIATPRNFPGKIGALTTREIRWRGGIPLVVPPTFLEQIQFPTTFLRVRFPPLFPLPTPHNGTSVGRPVHFPGELKHISQETKFLIGIPATINPTNKFPLLFKGSTDTESFDSPSSKFFIIFKSKISPWSFSRAQLSGPLRH